MAQDVRTPDFDDLLAAFDIPDVPSIAIKEEPTNDTNSSNTTTNKSTNQTRIVSTNCINRPKFVKIPDMTYQLTTNVLPPYIPEECPPDKLKNPFDGHKCVDCGDQFVLESSLKQHLERRSVYISLTCDTCQKVLIYYNRCNLLTHIRNHRDKNEPCDIRKAEVGPLPRELMDIISLHAPVNGVVNGNVILSHVPVTNVSENSKIKKIRCSECHQLFDTQASLSDHFSRSQNMPLATSQCPKCNMTCPSKCSLSAHQRIHLRTQPFTCPECGTKMVDNWSSFQQHLSMWCLHYSRSIGYKCSICAILHLDGESLRQHIIELHGEVYYKCQACPMAFKAGITFEAHKKTSHLTMDMECKVIYKCPLCDTVFHSGELLDEHLDVHIKEQIKATKFVFKCLECGKLMDNKIILGDHMTQSHPHLIKRECCSVCGLVLDSKDALALHTIEFHNSEKKVKITYACSSCEMSYYSMKSLLRHERVMHNSCDRPKKYVCWICKKQGFTKRALLEKHVKMVHANEISTKPPIKIKISRPKVSDNPPIKCLRINDQGVYTCFKCDYVSKMRTNFITHIAEHKTDQNSLQCLECGDCFVVAPALRKHLAIVHRVKDVELYMDSEDSQSDVSNELECGVCFNLFSNELTLKTHMRTHGMAFIRSKTSL